MAAAATAAPYEMPRELSVSQNREKPRAISSASGGNTGSIYVNSFEAALEKNKNVRSVQRKRKSSTRWSPRRFHGNFNAPRQAWTAKAIQGNTTIKSTGK